MKYYLYAASAPIYMKLSIIKLGCTQDLYGRNSTYLTGCPPGLTPSHDIFYECIWEVEAESRECMYDFEDELHNKFHRFRMMREKPGDSEWFHFHIENPLDELKSFMATRAWVTRIVPVDEIRPCKRPTRFLNKSYFKNTGFIRNDTKRLDAMNTSQAPVIEKIIEFIADSKNQAGYIIAPCGSGKTHMVGEGMKRAEIKRCIVCCPSNQIQQQWAIEMQCIGLYSCDDILLIGSTGTTQEDTVLEFMKKDQYCIITTYMSSKLLVPLVNETAQIIVLDEAHHLAGVVAQDDNGEGITRKLMVTAVEKDIKRLSLTFTPRIICADGNSETNFLTMDDDNVFGTKIAELKLRQLIRKGILPDYRVWTLRDSTSKGTGIVGKAESILEAWSATEFIRGEDKHILHHLIIFTSTNEEAKQLETYYKLKVNDTIVLRVQAGDNIKQALERFQLAERAIIINCKVLGEGVDIPIANSVAITYPKHAKGEITQMVLRAGRWYENKPLFHILLPIMDDNDMSGFEDVLTALASCDELVRDEIVFRASGLEKEGTTMSRNDTNIGEVLPECIMIDEYSGTDLNDIKLCFSNIRRNIFPSKETKRIQELCIEKGIDTQLEYEILRTHFPDLPADPRFKNQTWYDFLHPRMTKKISIRDFVHTILEKNNLRMASTYEAWRVILNDEERESIPSVGHINNGYFGCDDTNFNRLIEKYGTKIIRRTR